MRERHRFDLEKLRIDVAAGLRPLRITTHAQVEAFKDGLTLADLRYTFEHGALIEVYPEENRGLLFVNIPAIAMPVHIVLEDTPTQGVIITAYVPDRRLWIGNRSRKPKR
jgi:hypothetical protein